MHQWVTELKNYLPLDTPIIIAGNKCDIPTKAISKEMAERYAREHNSLHLETSAKTGKNVEILFRTLAESKNLC